MRKNLDFIATATSEAILDFVEEVEATDEVAVSVALNELAYRAEEKAGEVEALFADFVREVQKQKIADGMAWEAYYLYGDPNGQTIDTLVREKREEILALVG